MTSKDEKAASSVQSDSAGPEKRMRDMLRDSADNLDAHIRSRLTQARHAAVEESRRHRLPLRWQVLVPAGSLAAAAALAFLLWSGRQDGQLSPLMAETETQLPVEGAAQSPIDDLEILVASESFELLEDLEFYDSMVMAEDLGADIG